MLKKPISADSHITEPPNCYVDFIDPKFRDRAPQMKRLDRVGDANDFPHSDSTWPWSQAMLNEHESSLSEQERNWICHENVAELYGLRVH